MKSTFRNSRIVFLLLFIFLFINVSVYSVRASPDKETLYVNGFDLTYTDWSTSGISPYINDSDDYIYTMAWDGAEEGNFTFADTVHSGDTFNFVEIYFECYQEGSGEWFDVWIYDGSSWTDIGDITPDSSYSWKSMNVTSKIDSWTKVDSCQIYVVYRKAGKPQNIYVRRCYLDVDYTAGYNLNLRVLDWDLTDAIQGAIVYKDSDYLTSDENGWANWTQVSGTVEIQVKYFGFWVNSTSVTMDSDKTIDLQCRLYDVIVAVQETLQNAILVPANVSVFNGSSTQVNRIATGITNSSGQLFLYNLPNSTLTFTLYAGSDYTLKIGNSTQLVSSEGQSITRTADENYIITSHVYNLIVFVGFVLPHFFKRPQKRCWGLRLRRKQKQYKLKPNSENTYNAS